jgi:L-fuculose-phosphate aldolase
MTMFPAENLAKQMMLDVVRRMSARGYLASNDVNLSWRIGSSLFLTLATGIFVDTLDENMILKMDFDGNLRGSYGCYTPSPDAGLHIRIFKQFPQVLGVINAQPPYATLCAAAAKPLEQALLPKTVLDLGVLPLVPYAEPGSLDLEEKVATACKSYNGLLLENRGILVWGINLFEAYHRLELAEQYAFLSWHLGFSGKYSIQAEQVEILLKQRELWDIQTGGTPKSRQKEANYDR